MSQQALRVEGEEEALLPEDALPDEEDEDDEEEEDFDGAPLAPPRVCALLLTSCSEEDLEDDAQFQRYVRELPLIHTMATASAGSQELEQRLVDFRALEQAVSVGTGFCVRGSLTPCAGVRLGDGRVGRRGGSCFFLPRTRFRAHRWRARKRRTMRMRKSSRQASCPKATSLLPWRLGTTSMWR